MFNVFFVGGKELYGCEKTEYAPGDKVTFMLPIILNEPRAVVVNGEEIQSSYVKHGFAVYTFTMPNRDVSVMFLLGNLTVGPRPVFSPVAEMYNMGYRVCPKCGVKCSPTAKFCHECGTKFEKK